MASIEDLKKDKNIDAYKEEDFKKIIIPHLRLFYKWKHKNPIPPGSNNHLLFAAWRIAKEELSYWRNRNSNESFWGQGNEDSIVKLETKEIQIKDTELGRKIGAAARSATCALNQMSQEDIEALPVDVLAELRAKLTSIPVGGDTSDINIVII